MYVLEIHPWEEPGSAPSRTTQGLTNIIEAALRKPGSEARFSPSTVSSVWSDAWRSIDLMTPEMFCSWSTQVGHRGQEFEVPLLRGQRRQFPQKTHRVFFYRGMMRINGLRGCLMKREKRERHQINTDRAVIGKKRRRFQLIVQAWGWMTILSFRCLFLLLPSFHCDCWHASTLQLILVRKCCETTTVCNCRQQVDWWSSFFLLFICFFIYASLSLYDVIKRTLPGAFKAIATLLELIISVYHSSPKQRWV